jgi:hypothetical protein
MMPPEPKNHLATRVDRLVHAKAAEIAGDVEIADVVETIWQFIESGALRLVDHDGSIRIEPGGTSHHKRAVVRTANKAMMRGRRSRPVG